MLLIIFARLNLKRQICYGRGYECMNSVVRCKKLTNVSSCLGFNCKCTTFRKVSQFIISCSLLLKLKASLASHYTVTEILNWGKKYPEPCTILTNHLYRKIQYRKLCDCRCTNDIMAKKYVT